MKIQLLVLLILVCATGVFAQTASSIKIGTISDGTIPISIEGPAAPPSTGDIKIEFQDKDFKTITTLNAFPIQVCYTIPPGFAWKSSYSLLMQIKNQSNAEEPLVFQSNRGQAAIPLSDCVEIAAKQESVLSATTKNGANGVWNPHETYVLTAPLVVKVKVLDLDNSSQKLIGSATLFAAGTVAPSAPALGLLRFSKLKFSVSNSDKNVESVSNFNFDSQNPPQTFTLELEDINRDKPLVLGVGIQSCEQIANWVNAGAVDVDPSWWQSWWNRAKQSTSSVGSYAWSWLPAVLVGDSVQVQQGVQKVKKGDWLTGGAQITGGEIGRLLYAAFRGVYHGVKGIGLTLWEGGKAIYYEIYNDIWGTTPPASAQAPSGQPSQPIGTSGGQNVSELITTPGVVQGQFLQVDAENQFLYVVGNKDWKDRSGMLPQWLLQKIDNTAVASLSNGKTYTFIACQFDQAENGVKATANRSAAITLSFGKSECSTLLECLKLVDEKFLRIFGLN